MVLSPDDGPDRDTMDGHQQTPSPFPSRHPADDAQDPGPHTHTDAAASRSVGACTGWMATARAAEAPYAAIVRSAARDGRSETRVSAQARTRPVRLLVGVYVAAGFHSLALGVC